MVQRFVKEFGLVTEQVLITANNRLVAKFNVEISRISICKTNTVFPVLVLLLYWVFWDNVDLFRNFISFFKNIFLHIIKPWFQRLQQRNHKLWVLRVGPIIEISFSLRIPVHLLQFEVAGEHVQEVCEEEIFVNVCLDVIGKLVHESLIFGWLNRIVLIVLPVVLEIVFKAFGHLARQGPIFVKMGQKSEPFWQIFAVFIISGHRLQIHQNFDKLAHNVRECGDTDKQNKCGHETLNFWFRVKIAEADRRQGREGKIDDNNQILPLVIWRQIILVVEGELIVARCRVLGNDEPDCADEVGEHEDEDNEAKNAEDIHNIDLLHDFVIVFLVVLLVSLVVLNWLIELSSIDGFYKYLETLSVDDCDRAHQPQQAQQVQQAEFVPGDFPPEKLLERYGRNSDYLNKEAPFQVSDRDESQITDRLPIFIILILQEESLEDINEEEGLHKVIKDNGAAVRGLPKTTIEAGLQSGAQSEDCDQDVQHLNKRVIFTHYQTVWATCLVHSLGVSSVSFGYLWVEIEGSLIFDRNSVNNRILFEFAFAIFFEKFFLLTG